jgi:hypothetical protein
MEKRPSTYFVYDHRHEKEEVKGWREALWLAMYYRSGPQETKSRARYLQRADATPAQAISSWRGGSSGSVGARRTTAHPCAARAPFPTRRAIRTRSPQQEPEQQGRIRIPGMPDLEVVYYRDVARKIKLGELIAGMHGNGTARMATWYGFKIVLVLGGSGSGKPPRWWRRSWGL